MCELPLGTAPARTGGRQKKNDELRTISKFEKSRTNSKIKFFQNRKKKRRTVFDFQAHPVRFSQQNQSESHLIFFAPRRRRSQTKKTKPRASTVAREGLRSTVQRAAPFACFLLRRLQIPFGSCFTPWALSCPLGAFCPVDGFLAPLDAFPHHWPM